MEAFRIPAITAPASVAMRMLDAFNRRDRDALFACLAQDVEIHPLKLHGIGNCYRGHAGVREWFATVAALGHDHHIAGATIEDAHEATVLISGTLEFAPDIETPFCGVYKVHDGLIHDVRHYMSDVDTVKRLGLA